MPYNLFSNCDFEFYYLVELTKQKIKPLSRWEKPIQKNAVKWIMDQGLFVDTVQRKTLFKKEITETIFSASSRYLDFYKGKFHQKPLRKDEESQKIEGFLFGYPYCCVQQFIRKPYSANQLSKKDQSLLFHWACKNCASTAELMPYYQNVHKQIYEWFKHELGEKQCPKFHSRTRLSKRLALAATLSLLISSGLLSAQSLPDSTHLLTVDNDTDNDGLNYAEEFYQGTAFNDPFSQGGLDEDGIYWSLFYKSIIDSLPDSVQTDKVYKLDFQQWGLETCAKCGTVVNMGYLKIVNPLRHLEIDIPYIGLHYLENGCFSYWGDIHNSRVDIDTLKKIIFPLDSLHLLPVARDSDSDGLTDEEEDSLYLNPNVQDTDGDGVNDGAQIAEQLIRLFPKLKEHVDNIHAKINFNYVYGLENCQVCGVTHNMGSIDFENPENGRTSQIHFNGLHAMAHGSFAYDGTVYPNQRADVVELYRTMKTHSLFIDNDSDNDGLTDIEEQYFGFNPDLADTDSDGISDGMELSLSMTSIIDSLPTSAIPDGPYVIHTPTWGSYNCLICGEAVNMGFMEIFNPNVSADSIQISYYAFHFMKKGSFAYEGRIDGGTWIDGRIDPVQLAQYLEFTPSSIQNSSKNIVESFELKQNYPNPFNSTTNIYFTLPESEYVTLKIFDIQGKVVATLVSMQLKSGRHVRAWDATEFAGGVYFYKLETNSGFRQTRKLILLK